MKPLTEDQIEYLSELPKAVYTDTDKRSPMFNQWVKMLDACGNPDSKFWPLFGGGTPMITVYRKWYVFSNFLEDMSPTFEIRPDKPPSLRRNYLHRRNLRAGFNPSNTIWVPKREAMTMHPNVGLYDTPFGKRMTLREISQYLRDHAGEDWPDGREYTLRVREYDDREKLVTVSKVITTIQPIALTELRKRSLAGKDLFRPTRPYGNAEDIRETLAADKSSERMSRVHRMAAERGLSIAAFLMHYDDNGRPLV